ncbi:MAG TPA: glycosyltransferase family 39 protein [Thermoanaerobaculia bacterium]|nr:glycosyltransferase family 39 protein [Thermoanaerobaculia bacterium]
MLFLTLVVGIGTLGQVFFVAGWLFTIYKKPVAWTAVIVLTIIGLAALVRDFATVRSMKERPTLAGSALALVLTALVSAWFVMLRGFLTGSDIFSHHYTHVKVMIHAGRFVHDVMLPWGTDIHSNYNPTLVHILYVLGHLLVDERVSNLFHWLTQVLLIVGIYVCIRQLASRAAGLLGITLYFGGSILANFVPDVQDYSMTAIFTLGSLSALVMAQRMREPGLMLLSGVLCGFAMSSKYYAFVFLPPLMLIVLLKTESALRDRIRDCCRIGVAALVAVSPWLAYNFVQFGDPLYPVFKRLPDFSLFAVSYPMHMLRDFIVTGTHGITVPTFFYYISMFIPYNPGLAQFGLGIMFLISLPPVAVFVVRQPAAMESRIALAAIVMFVGLHLVFGRVAFYKWVLFPAVLYVVALSVMAHQWRSPWRQTFWLAAVAAAALNYVCLVQPVLRTYTPADRQSDLWDEESKSLNGLLPPDAVVAGVPARTQYYLRDDVVGIRARDSLALDWDAEQRVLAATRTEYFVDFPASAISVQRFYGSLIDAWLQVSPDDRRNAEYLMTVAAQLRETQRRKELFLASAGTFVKDIGGGAKLYRLDWSRLRPSGLP